jgi:hypothetical protein
LLNDHVVQRLSKVLLRAHGLGSGGLATGTTTLEELLRELLWLVLENSIESVRHTLHAWRHNLCVLFDLSRLLSLGLLGLGALLSAILLLLDLVSGLLKLLLEAFLLCLLSSFEVLANAPLLCGLLLFFAQDLVAEFFLLAFLLLHLFLELLLLVLGHHVQGELAVQTNDLLSARSLSGELVIFGLLLFLLTFGGLLRSRD